MELADFQVSTSAWPSSSPRAAIRIAWPICSWRVAWGGQTWQGMGKETGGSNLPPNLISFDQNMSKWPWISVSLSLKFDLTQTWICLRMYPKSLARASQTFQYWFGEWLELNLKCREGGLRYSRKLDQAVLERLMSSIDAGKSFTEQNRIL